MLRTMNLNFWRQRHAEYFDNYARLLVDEANDNNLATICSYHLLARFRSRRRSNVNSNDACCCRSRHVLFLPVWQVFVILCIFTSSTAVNENMNLCVSNRGPESGQERTWNRCLKSKPEKCSCMHATKSSSSWTFNKVLSFTRNAIL